MSSVAPPGLAGVWSAPGRVNLIGEHTDYNNGLVLPVALQERTHASVSVRDDAVLRVSSDQQPGSVEVAIAEIAPGLPTGWAAYVAGVVWALREEGYAVPGLDVHIRSDVPVGAGLSSSAALECSVGAAVSDLLELGLLADDAGRAALGRMCQRAENEIALAPTGGMDQAIAMRARTGHALLLDCRTGRARHVPVDFTAHGLTLVVIDTRAKHALVDGQYADRRASCEAAAHALGLLSLRDATLGDIEARLSGTVAARARHVVTEIERVRQCVAALEAHDFVEVGRLFTQSHISLRDDFEVSCVELDLVVDTALAHGALGARMTGGGFGGSAIAVVPTDRRLALVEAVAAAFAEQGFTPPEALVAEPGDGARRDPTPTP